MFNANGKKLAAIEAVVRGTERGIHKRIDENRELLEYLQKHVPTLMEKHRWVEGWLESQDRFLTELLRVVPVAHPIPEMEQEYPRPWPGGSGHKRVDMANSGAVIGEAAQ